MMRMGARGFLPLRPLTELEMVKRVQESSIRFSSSGGQKVMAIRRYAIKRDHLFILKMKMKPSKPAVNIVKPNNKEALDLSFNNVKLKNSEKNV